MIFSPKCIKFTQNSLLDNTNENNVNTMKGKHFKNVEEFETDAPKMEKPPVTQSLSGSGPANKKGSTSSATLHIPNFLCVYTLF